MAAANHNYDQSLALWEQENEVVIAERVAAKQVLADAESMLRDTVKAIYEATGNKAPAPGLGIREVTTLDVVNPQAAVEWAQRTGLALIPASLDCILALKYIKAGAIIPGVEKVVKVTATIATDLGKALAEAERKGG